MAPGSSPPRTQDVNECTCCGAVDAVRLFATHDVEGAVEGIFSYSRCRPCGSVFQNPRIVEEDLHLLYPQRYYELQGVEDPVSQHQEARWRPLSIATRAISVLGRAALVSRDRLLGVPVEVIPTAGDRRVLDVGCGTGNSLTTLRKLGWSVAGVEWDTEAAHVAQERDPEGVIYVGHFLRVNIPMTFDLIFLNHVIEHAHNVLAWIRRIEQLLSPTGKVVLVFPNPNAFGARRFGRAWYPWEAPRHLVLPSIRGLRMLVGSTGLCVESVRTTSRYAAYFCSQSRRVRAGGRTATTRSDRLFAVAETLALGLGFSVGEEVVAVLRKKPVS